MMRRPDNAQGASSRWLVYFVAENLDAMITSIGELGGTIMIPPMSVPPRATYSSRVIPRAQCSPYSKARQTTEGPTETQAKRLTRFPLGELS